MLNGKKIVCIIPARLGSYRFRDKCFAEICGKPMVEHVYKRAKMADFLDGVYVATPDEEIKRRVEGFGGEAIMTSHNHKRAVERVAEAALILGNEADIVINLQGDEPLVNPDIIRLSAEPLLCDDPPQCVYLARKAGYEQAKDIHEVKVVTNQEGNALFFSREPIPSRFMGDKKIDYLIVVVVNSFTKESLQLFTRLENLYLETIESADMLRWIEHGYKVKIVESTYETYSVDVPEDIEKVEKVMRTDELFQSYL